MSRVIEKPSWWSRFLHLFVGFDGPLAFAVFMLACAGLIICRSNGAETGRSHGGYAWQPSSLTGLSSCNRCHRHPAVR